VQEWLRRSLISHLHPTSSVLLFPRDALVPYGRDPDTGEPLYTRLTLDSELAYYFLFEKTREDFYVAVYSNDQIQKKMIDTVFIDIDADNLNEAYEKLWIVLRKLEGLGIDPGRLRIYFSGKKGFHVFLDFEPLYLPPFIHLGSLLHRALKSLGIAGRFIDQRVLGDWRRVSRVPFTRHSKSGLYCIPIDPTQDIISIQALASKLESGREIVIDRENCRPFRNLLKNILRRYSSYRRVITVEVRLRESRHVVEMPPCIRAWLRELASTGELDHYARLNLAIFLWRMGWRKEDIVELFKFARDFDEHKTTYQIEYAVKRDLLMWSCPKLIDLGLCPLANNPRSCPFYPSINRYFGWRKREETS